MDVEKDEPCKTCGGSGWLWANFGKIAPHKEPCPDCQPSCETCAVSESCIGKGELCNDYVKRSTCQQPPAGDKK